MLQRKFIGTAETQRAQRKPKESSTQPEEFSVKERTAVFLPF
jgi:hypothetical protein